MVLPARKWLTLSSLMHTQSYEANYGVGAKVATPTRNLEELNHSS